MHTIELQGMGSRKRLMPALEQGLSDGSIFNIRLLPPASAGEADVRRFGVSVLNGSNSAERRRTQRGQDESIEMHTQTVDNLKEHLVRSVLPDRSGE
ncbi:hypothetical protein [Paraburkholderia youngii]|uniref:hypothetical protein n=1 Tax=Paraburkholderia youngii TaxID=2782701 RepID=UPI003D2434FE